MTEAIAERSPAGRASKDAEPSNRLQAIISAAADLFLDHGYHKVSMEDIAARVGLRKPTLYHYVSSKVEILSIMAREYMDIAFASTPVKPGAGRSAADELLDIMSGIIGAIETHRSHMQVLFEYNRELPARDRRTIKQRKEKFQSLLEQAVERGIASGEFRAVDKTMVTLGILGMCIWAYKWYNPAGKHSPRSLASLYLEMLTNGLAPR